MKTIVTLIVTAAVALGATFNTAAQNNDTKEAEAKKFSILGDSYSTFAGHNPDGYAPFYPNDRNDVTKVEETWWDLYINAMGYVLEANNSWGGTNDAWAGSPIGEYQYEGWTKEDCKSFRPALSCWLLLSILFFALLNSANSRCYFQPYICTSLLFMFQNTLL